MTPSKNLNVSPEFIRSLETTTHLVQRLSDDIRESEVDFASIKTELRILISDVKELASFLRDNETSISELKLKIALLEKSVEDLEQWISEKKKSDDASKIADKTGKWQTITASVTGGLALVAGVISLLIHLLK